MGIERIFGSGNVQNVNANNVKKSEAPMGAIRMTSVGKTEDNGFYPGLKLSTTPGNTGVNESTARGFLGILDYMADRFN